ncbi:hypothetical protein [Arthrobacter sp. Soil763]|uniref:hypothetical protein n=1 Tax=Arthrobacter sp. Soil763 TaxID=1736402 RepID=UPI0007009C2F|nr:hypothetical protein [Arthrobacter sp. Soil763]KRE82107.1 hypothetical protein ASG71_03445 [Arthrobacter sp. Soil763]
MEDPTTIGLNLTFFGTLGVGLLMFLGVFLAFVITLLIAGAGRLLAVVLTALFRGAAGASKGPRRAPGSAQASGATPETAANAKPGWPLKTGRPARREPQLSADWTAAVERADARARERARAEAALKARDTRPAQDTERKAS